MPRLEPREGGPRGPPGRRVLGPDAVVLPAVRHAAFEGEKIRMLSDLPLLLPERRVLSCGRVGQENDFVYEGSGKIKRRL